MNRPAALVTIMIVMNAFCVHATAMDTAIIIIIIIINSLIHFINCISPIIHYSTQDDNFKSITNTKSKCQLV